MLKRFSERGHRVLVKLMVSAVTGAALIATSACSYVFGAIPPAGHVRASQLVGTWHSRECKATLRLNANKSGAASGVPTDMPPPGLSGPVKRFSGDGTWKIFRHEDVQSLDFEGDNVEIVFDLFVDGKRLVVVAFVGDDPDNSNSCEFARDRDPAPGVSSAS
ncbi:hypothetical protein ACFW1M_02400 [Streptomyces inhibens]|uniref:hypothetical protein n=1 Tax=Streptomyces inhibens TaxID=2293571 RepID=UPI0036C59953